MRRPTLLRLKRSRRRRIPAPADDRPLPNRRRLLCELLEDRRLLHAALGEPQVELAAIGDGDLGEIHGHVWDDLDGNGEWNDGEPGLANRTVYLDHNQNGQHDSGEQITRTVADDPDTPEDETGSYTFAGLAPDTYTVAQQPQPGWQQTFPAETAAPEVNFVSVNVEPEGDMPRALVYTTDGASVLVVNRDSDNMAIYDANTFELTDMIPVGDGPVDVAVSADGRYAVVPNRLSDTVSIIDLVSRSVAAEVPITGSQPYDVEVTADSSSVVVGVINDGLRSSFSVISLSTLTEVRSFPSTPQFDIGGSYQPECRGSEFTQFAVSSDNTPVVLPDRRNARVMLYDLHSGTELASLATTGFPSSVDVSRDGTTAVVSHQEGRNTISRIDLVGRSLAGSYPILDFLYGDIRVTHDGTRAVADTGDGVVFVDLSTGATTGTLDYIIGTDIQLSFDGKYALVGGQWVVDIDSQTVVAEFAHHAGYTAMSPVAHQAAGLRTLPEEVIFYRTDPVANISQAVLSSGSAPEADGPISLAISAGGETLAAGNYLSGNVSIIDVETETMRSLVDTGEGVIGVGVTPDGSLAVVANYESDTVSIVDLTRGVVVATLADVGDGPSEVLISPDGRTAYVSSTNSTKDKLHFIHLDGAHSHVVSSLDVSEVYDGVGGTYAFGNESRMALSKDGSVLGTVAGRSQELLLVDTSTRTEMARILLPDSGLQGVAFSPDGSKAYVRNGFGSIHVVNIDGTASALAATIPGTILPQTMTVDATGAFVYVIAEDNDHWAVHVIDTSSNTIVQIVPLPSQRVQAACFSAAESVLYVAAYDFDYYHASNFQIHDGWLYRIDAAGADSSLIDSMVLTEWPADLVVSENFKKAILSQPIPDGVDIIDFAGLGARIPHTVELKPGELAGDIDFGGHWLGWDFGDAPYDGSSSMYPTLSANDGAWHGVVPGFHLGRQVDGEADGQPTADASGDDTNGVHDDEDGVTIGDELIRGDASAAVDVFVTNTVSDDAFLDAWIDFDGNGTWDATERIFSGPVRPGSNTISFSVPSDAQLGDTYARFRLNSIAAGLSPAGAADDGEVEDYRVTIAMPGGVLERYVFYNNSAYDNSILGSTADDAIAPDKRALLPGETATFANYTSCSRGINGLMVDVGRLPEGSALGVDDFEFRVGNSDDPSAWQVAPEPTLITVRRRDGVLGSDRVTLIWTDGVVRNQWLQVTVRATPATGLAGPDVFYFGNAVGETGNSTSDAMVTSIDELLVRLNPKILDPAPLDDRYDFNRDGMVTATDQIIARNNVQVFDALRLITAPANDAVFEEPFEGQSGSPVAPAGTLAWLGGLGQTSDRSGASKKAGVTDAALDTLMATYVWV